MTSVLLKICNKAVLGAPKNTAIAAGAGLDHYRSFAPNHGR